MASTLHLVLTDDAPAAAGAAAGAIAAELTRVLERRPRAHVAFSGSATPLPMFDRLVAAPLDWNRVEVYQVDERAVPPDDPDRNATGLTGRLTGPLGLRAEQVHLLPVDAEDLEASASAFGASLPDLDVVHLGLGDDGHTASWPPGDPVGHERERLVEVVGPYRGHRRMTITPAAVERAAMVVFLVVGASKHRALHQLLAGDPAITASAVPLERTMVVCDRAAYDGPAP